MLLFYVDERGDTSLKRAKGSPGQIDPGVSHTFNLTAVGVRDSSRRPIAEALAEIKTRVFGPQWLDAPWGDSEIKGRYLRRAAKSAANGKTLQSPALYRTLSRPRQVEEFAFQLQRLFAIHRPIIFSINIDKQQLVDHKPESFHEPSSLAYGLLHERIALLLEKLYPGESAVLIADQQMDHEKHFRTGDFNRVRAEVAQNLRVQPNFDLVVDKPLWVDTAYSSWDRELIQLADIAAYATYECVDRGAAPDEPELMWAEISRSLALHFRTAEPLQAGFTVFPRHLRQYPEL